MRKGMLGLGLLGLCGMVGGLANAMPSSGKGKFLFEVETGYLKFKDDSSNEYKSKWEAKVKAGYLFSNGLFVDIGDRYQNFKLADWLKDISKEKDFYGHSLFVNVGKIFNKAIFSVGIDYIKGKSTLLADDAKGIHFYLGVNLIKNEWGAIDLGIFNSYLHLSTDGDKGDILQATPLVVAKGKNWYGKVYINLENIATNIDEDENKLRISGGIEGKYFVLPKVSVIGGVKIGKSIYFNDGEGIDIPARYNTVKAYIGTEYKLIPNIGIKLTLDWERYKTIDKDKSQTANGVKIDDQNGYGLSVGLSYNF